MAGMPELRADGATRSDGLESLLGDVSTSEQYANYDHGESGGYQKTFGARRRVDPMKLLIGKFTIVLGHGRVLHSTTRPYLERFEKTPGSRLKMQHSH